MTHAARGEIANGEKEDYYTTYSNLKTDTRKINFTIIDSQLLGTYPRKRAISKCQGDTTNSIFMKGDALNKHLTNCYNI